MQIRDEKHHVIDSGDTVTCTIIEDCPNGRIAIFGLKCREHRHELTLSLHEGEDMPDFCGWNSLTPYRREQVKKAVLAYYEKYIETHKG